MLLSDKSANVIQQRELRDKAEKTLKLLLRYDDLSIPPADIQVICDFAQRHAAEVGKVERLKGRIEELKQVHAFAHQAGPEFSRWLRSRWADYQSELAALEKGEVAG